MSRDNRRRVMLISADGMRPDLFNPERMPTIARLIDQGVRIDDYHAAYPTHSRVNITTIATGCLPGKHGIAANVFKVDTATEDGVIDTASFRHIQALDSFTGGRAIQAPTLPEMLSRQGLRSQIVATSSDAAGLIWNRHDPESVFDLNQHVHRPGIDAVRQKLGPVPPEDLPHRIPHVEYTARAVSEHYLDDPDLAFIGVWLSEPDYSLHHFGLGSAEVDDALEAVDRAVFEILDGLERRGVRDQFDILLISDHGHSTVLARKSLDEHLNEAVPSLFPELPALATASDFLYPVPSCRVPTVKELAPLVEWIQDQPWCGAVLSGCPEMDELRGVLPLSEVWGGHPGDRAPLLAVTPSWSHLSNRRGVPGVIAGLTEQVALRSTHGSASPYDLHAFAVFSGPDFQSGTRSQVAAGAQDLAPTISHILGLQLNWAFDGRILSELVHPSSEVTPQSRGRVVFPRVSFESGYRPAMILHDVAGSSYLHSAINGRRWLLDADRTAELPVGTGSLEVANT